MEKTPQKAQRQRWMGVLARAPEESLEMLLDPLLPLPKHDVIRAPESGLVMMRGRAGGTGLRFNVGELSVTRCSVRLADGTVGHAYVSGRARCKALYAALLDAMLQTEVHKEDILNKVIVPLEEAEETRQRENTAKSAATKVDFFTMVRGE